MLERRFLSLLAACLAACGPVDAPDPAVGNETFSGHATVLQADFIDGLILVEVAVEGTPGWWILDSGYDYSLIDSTVAANAGMQVSEMETVPQPGGSVSQQWTKAAALSLPSGSWTADSLAVLNLGGLAPFVGRPMAGLLGHDFFADHVITIDYESGLLTVASPDSYQGPADATEVPVWIESGEPFVLGVLWAANRSVPAKLKIDTGSISGLGLNGSFVAQNALIPPDWPRTSVGGVAVGGDTENFVTRLDSIRFGGRVIREPIVGWSADLERVGDAGTLGAPLLERFRVTFDYARMRLLLEPKPDSDDPEVGDSAGMLVVQPPAGDVMVAQVLPGSPAEAAGLQPGDVIQRIGTLVAADLGLGTVRRHFKQPGTVDTLSVVRGGSELQAILEQRRLP